MGMLKEKWRKNNNKNNKLDKEIEKTTTTNIEEDKRWKDWRKNEIMIEDKTPSKINLEINKTDSTPEKDYIIYEPILKKSRLDHRTSENTLQISTVPPRSDKITIDSSDKGRISASTVPADNIKNYTIPIPARKIRLDDGTVPAENGKNNIVLTLRESSDVSTVPEDNVPKQREELDVETVP